MLRRLSVEVGVASPRVSRFGREGGDENEAHDIRGAARGILITAPP